jgi:tetratricopeptide (TPR) repeat protein
MSDDEALSKQLDLVDESRSMAPEEALLLEKQVSDGDTSLESRLKLLGYYSPKQYSSSVSKSARIKHIAWMVTNYPSHFVSGMPECSVLRGSASWRDFHYISKLWRQQAKSHWSDPKVLGNVGDSFILNQIELAERYFIRAKELEPDNSRWLDRLSQVYEFMGPTYEHLALAERERSYSLSDGIFDRLSALIHLPGLAYEAGDFEKTVAYAADLLELAEASKQEKGWQFQYPMAIEAAHIALGRLALRHGDVKTAAQHLLQTLPEKRGEFDGLYPDSQLTAELFAAGERKAVLEWIERCKQYLKIPDWKERVERGISPWPNELPERHRYYCLSRLPRSAFNAGDFEKAERFANEFIEMASGFFKGEKRHAGYGLHTAYNVLGQLALRAGDIEGAKNMLAQAGAVPNADRLVELGPDLDLAAELTNIKETGSVCKFLKDCKRLWKSKDAVLLKEWEAEVAEGKVPDDWRIFLQPID